MSSLISGWASRHLSLKFSRDNEQIFALNYENLCDNDYLNRLFTTDGATEHEQSQLDAWALVGDLPEDLLIFGDQPQLANDIMLYRMLEDENSLPKCFDGPSETIFRQIFVFERIGKLVVEKCESLLESKQALKTLVSPAKETTTFVSKALSSALKVIEKNIGHDLNLVTITSLISLLSQFFQYSVSANVAPAARLSPMHLHMLRCVLCNGLKHGISSTEGDAANPIDVVESLKLAITCAYGLLVVGLNTGSVGDILLGMSQLLAVSLSAEGKQVELEEALSSTDNELNMPEKIRKKVKMYEMRTVVGSKKQIPQSSLPEGDDDDEDIPQRELGNFEVKIHGLKAKTGSSQQTRNAQSSHTKQQGVGDKKLSLQFVKGMRPGAGTGGGLFEGDVMLDAVAGASSNNNYPVASWRVSTEHTQKKFHLVSGAKNVPQAASSQPSCDDGAVQMRYRARSALAHIQQVPRDILDSVVLNCSTKGSLKGESLGVNSFASPKIVADAAVWTCGQNSYGELGHGDINLRRAFARVAYFDSKNIGCIGAGNEHSLFVSQQGKTYVCGYNDNGQCGMGTNQQVRHPVLIPFLEGEDVINVYVFNGCEHTLVQTRDGKLFSFGYNYRGQLGLGSTSSEPIPRPIKGIMSRKVTMAACSYHHTVVVCSDKTVFSFGRNDCGQLGHGDVIDKKHPHIVPGLEAVSVVSVSCGQFHTVLVTAEGAVMVCGKNDYGQLGLDGSDNVKAFSPLTSSGHIIDNIVQVCCGYYHTILLSRHGLVYGFGRNDYGQLGLGHAQPRMYGINTNSYLRDKSVVSLAAGCYHSIAVTSNGMLYVFGRNNHGQLGTGDIDERHSPHPVDDFVGKKIIQIAAGFYHTVVLVSNSADMEKSNGFDGVSAEVERSIAPQSSDDEKLTRPTVPEREVSDQQDVSRRTKTVPRQITVRDMQGGNLAIGVRDLFMFLTSHLEESLATSTAETTGVALGVDSMDNIRSIGLQLRTTAMALQINRQCVNGSLCIDMPFSQEETFSILGTVLRIADKLLSGLMIADILKHHGDCDDILKDDTTNYADLLLHQNPTAFGLLSAQDVVDRIASIHEESTGRKNLGSSCENDVKVDVTRLTSALFELRLELLFVYFFLQEVTCDQSARVIHMTSLCLSKHFEILFWSTNSRCKLISFLADCLVDVSATNGDDYYDTSIHTLGPDGISDSVDYSRSLRLFAQVCFKYRSINEVIALFRTSTYRGLLVYKYVLDVYINVSKHQLEQRFHNTAEQSYESLRALNTLEHCCTHFTKCSVPIIFDSARNASASENREVFSLGCTIIANIFSAAEGVLDILKDQSVSEDTRDALRTGTILCSVLPTFMLFSLSNVDICDSTMRLTTTVYSFMIKLQQFVGSADKDKGLSIQSSNSSKRLREDDFTAALNSPSKVGENSPVVKKDQTHIFWWTRLLKLSVVLCAKLSSSSLASRDQVTSNETDRTLVITAHQCELWKFFVRLSNDSWSLGVADEGGVRMLSVVEACRAHEAKMNLTYNTILITSKASKVMELIINVENLIADSVWRLQESFLGGYFISPELFFGKIWGSVSKLMTKIVRKRTELMSKSNGLTWSEMVSIVHTVVQSANTLLRAVVSCSGASPLCCPEPRNSKARSAFRRAVLVVVSVNRWKKCVAVGWSGEGRAIVSFYACVLEETLFALPVITAGAVKRRWKDIVSHLNTTTSFYSRQTAGILASTDLLSRMSRFPSIQMDILSILSAAWKDNMHVTSASHCLSAKPRTATRPICRSLDSCVQRVVALNKLVQHIHDSITHFCTAFCQGSSTVQGTQELTLFCLCVKFFRLLLSDGKGPLSYSYVFSSFNSLVKVIAAIDCKLVEMQTTDDRSGGGAAKRASYRERASYLRRTASVVASFVQSVSSKLVASNVFDSHFDSILHAHCDLLKQFHSSSQLVALSESSGLNFSGDNKDNMFAKNGKDANSHRRRCQELIVSPMQFSRNQEGFVVQGEKLLSNFKGIDFTLAFWVFISKKTNSKYSFLLGKVSHTDAWPLIGLRGSDMKIEVLFGRANEFERLTGQSVIPAGAWVHIAVVIDPRKVRLFVNGIMDCQMTTSGNARAILYPVIIGSCPPGVRTRVDYVKEGFDGLVASLKYYTRALSPIHVRVIYDQGPPEAHDARERLSYVTLASCMSLVSVIDKHKPLHEYTNLVSTLHALFLSDSNRLRYGALKMLGKVLELDFVEDMILSKNHKHISSEYSTVSGCSILLVDCLPEYSSFHERFVLYAIRLIGVCWSPSMVHGDLRPSSEDKETDKHADDAMHNDRLKSFLSFCPVFAGHDTLDPGSATSDCSSGGVVEVPVAREDMLGELCQSMTNLLRQLAHVSRWNTALSTVIYRCLCKCRVSVDSRSSWTDLVLADVLGAAVFLGGLPARPIVGSTVHCLYCSKDATVINIDKATNHATLLTINSIETQFQLRTVKTNELKGVDSTSVVALPSFVSHSILDLMDSLGGFVHVLMTDIMSVYRPDHVFVRHHMFRACRPIEAFVYHQLVRRLSESELAMADIRSRPSLFVTLLSNSVRASHNEGGDDKGLVDLPDSDRLISSLWMKSAPYVARMTYTVSEQDFPPLDSEVSFMDYAARNLGISMGSFQSNHGAMVRYGLVSELICSMACEEISADHAIAITSLSGRICNDSRADLALDEELTEQAVTCTMRLLFQLRGSIVHYSRKLFRSLEVDSSTFDSLKLPWKVMLWQQLAQEGETFRSSSLDITTRRFTEQLLRTHGTDVTHCLISSIRYTAISLLQHHGLRTTKRVSNIIESTDLTSRILQSMHLWLREHQGSNEEVALCQLVLKMLLPSLSCIESAEVELDVMTVCAVAVHRITVRLLGGFIPSPDLIEFVNGAIFAQLWSRAQEHVVQERGHAPFNMTSTTQNLVFLASCFAVMQRNMHRNRVLNADCEGVKHVSNVPSVTPRTPRSRSTTQIIPPAAKIVGKKSFSVEIDITEGIAHAHREHDNCSVYVEVALRVLCESSESEDCSVYDTIYYGSCGRFVHSGLCSNSMYSLKYRIVVDSSPGSWSPSTEFSTEASLSPFVFDSLKCGADIIVSQDGKTVSYTGDDNWSTVLGNTPFTNGINSWEIKIASSSTAYIFVGVATSTADLNTFLGGCADGWGFIGEQALYHGREKVKIYGEPFSAGDIVGVILDFNSGTLSFTRNGKSLGIAFDKIYGELYPAVAFYNVGQEVEIVSDSARTLCPPVPLPYCPSIVSMDSISMIHEMMYCLNTRSAFSPRILHVIAEHLTTWTSGTVVRRRAISGSQVFLSTKSQLLKQYDLRVGDRVRSQYGIAEIVGSAHGRVWFQTKEKSDVWYFSKQQVVSGRLKGLFQRCSYESQTEKPEIDQNGDHQIVFDAYMLQDMLDPQRWSEEIDETLVQFLLKACSKTRIAQSPVLSPWDISCQEVCDDFRTIQQQLSRVVIGSVELSHKWGVTGPKRKAVLARIGMLRLLNHLLEHTLPAFLPPLSSPVANSQSRKFADEHTPPSISLGVAPADQVFRSAVTTSDLMLTHSQRQNGAVQWPVFKLSWKSESDEGGLSPFLLAQSSRKYVFPDLKKKHFWRILGSSMAKVSKTDDDYDYPEDLPLVKLNRFRSFRAGEVSQLLGIPGDDLFYSTLFCQLWKELRQHSDEKLRISYTHPMDDGQSRTFKVRFEGEGVDDYGGPYREVFQKICEELQIQDPSFQHGRDKNPASTTESLLSGERIPAPCFIPLLLPTANWTAGQDCVERYRYTFHPSSKSVAMLDLFLFLGQAVGIALRSKITLDLPLSSFIWKSVVRESLTDMDIASFDVAACSYVQYLGSICQRLGAAIDSNDALDSIRDEASSVLRDVTWTVTYSDGQVVELIPNGKSKHVDVNDLSEYLGLYVEARLSESIVAVEAFRNGILSVIPESALSMLNWEELEMLVCGSKTVDIERLKANTEYDDDVSPSDSHIVAFWEVLSEFSEVEKAAFLRFVWARPTLPPKDVEFPQKLKIQSAVGDDASVKPDSYLPKAHTCFFSINLPRYSSKTVMAEKLRYAVVHCTEMDADFRVTDPDVVGWSTTTNSPSWSSFTGAE